MNSIIYLQHFKWKYLLIALLFLGITYSHAHSQRKDIASKQNGEEANPQINSLLKNLKTANEDTNKVNGLNRLFREHQNTDPVKALDYAEKAVLLSEKLSFNKGLVEGWTNMGIYHYNQGDYPKALNYFKKTLELSKNSGFKLKTAESFNNIGVIYRKQGAYDKALDYFLKSLAIKEEEGNKLGVAATLTNIGTIHYNQTNYKPALNYLSKGLNIYEELLMPEKSDKGKIRLIKKRIAKTNNNIGNVHKDQHNNKKAFQHYSRALKINEELNDLFGIAKSVNNIGIIYERQEKYAEALKYYFKALKLNKELNRDFGIALTLSNIGNIYNKQGNSSQAILYVDTALVIVNRIGAKGLIKDIYLKMAETWAALDNYEKAYQFQELYATVKDSLLNEDFNRQIAEMETKYEVTKKEQDIVLLKKEKDWQIKLRNVFIGSFSLLLVFAFVIFRGYRQKRRANKLLATQNETIEKQKEVLQSSLHETNEELQQLTYQKKAISLKYSGLVINFKDILFVKAEGNYVKLHLADEKDILERAKLKDFAKHLPKDKFIQVHRSYIVNLAHIVSLNKENLKIGNTFINISKNFYPNLMRHYGVRK
ncbi:MAG: hypothetical protein COB85_07550 [Bacteroidetes bacterium]|nr:MAG: hypothetical protein COB85_07550 [Bacteroidota bacterium]